MADGESAKSPSSIFLVEDLGADFPWTNELVRRFLEIYIQTDRDLTVWTVAGPAR